MQKSAQKPQSRRGMESPKDICGFCVLLIIFVVKQVSSSENQFVVPPLGGTSDTDPFCDARHFRLKAGLRTTILPGAARSVSQNFNR
jgi:hypothetical protein